MMMKFGSALLVAAFAGAACANEPVELPAERIKALVAEVNEASNRMLKSGSKREDVDALFALYSDDFVYVHEAYGGQYSRDLLYTNSVKNLEAGRYSLAQDRYKLLNVLTGLNAAAVERQELKSGKVHLTLFEFKGGKVSNPDISYSPLNRAVEPGLRGMGWRVGVS